MATDLRDLRSELLRFAPEAPLSLVVDLLRESAREFFARSHAWRETFTIPLVDGQAVYELLDENNASVAATHYNVTDSAFEIDVVSWHEVSFNEAPIQKRTNADLHKRQPLSDRRFWAFSNPTKTSIMLHGTPTAAEDTELLTVTVSLRPALNRRVITNDEMIELYKDGIVSGALARLLLLPRQPWTDKSLVPFYSQRFEDAILDADNRAQTQHSRHIVRTTRYGGL